MTKKRWICILLAAAMGVMFLTGCGSDDAVGYWTIDEISAGDVVMTQEDAQSIGFTTAGSVKLQKSGACEVSLLGVEYEGSWSQAENGTVKVDYGDGLTLTGSISEGVMTLDDGEGTEYKLSK